MLLETKFKLTLKDQTWSQSESVPFKRLKIKCRENLLPLDGNFDPVESRGKHLNASEWNDLVLDPDTIIVDVRNDYESKIGTFKDSTIPNMKNFTEFPSFVENNLKDKKAKKIAMFCTGGIRCEIASSFMINEGFDEVYQLAADMGGAGYLFTGANDATVMHNSAQINLNVLETCRVQRVGRIFYSSSACVYPERNQLDPSNPVCTEDSVYPADPDSEYGWEKLFSERLYESYRRNFDMTVRIARYHNVYGPCGTWAGGREKVPAALCRKVATARAGTDIEIWGDGYQTRSFLYVDDCIEASLRLMRGDWAGPVNIGSSEMISINALAALIMEIADKNLGISHIEGPQGVRGRCSDNKLIQEKLGWSGIV